LNWLNYHHLQYFWVVAREGGISAASQKLRLAPSTLSAQIQQLEDACGHALFHRTGRRLVLTDIGQMALEYADEIFGLGRELMDVFQGRSSDRVTRRIHIGVTDVVPKLVALKLLEPLLSTETKLHIICRHDRTDRLLAELAIHHLDVVITDEPVGPDASVRVFNHQLGECELHVFGKSALATAVTKQFPISLQEKPFLVPTAGTSTRKRLDDWFESNDIRPRIIGEFDDSALMKEFGQAGAGFFVSPSVIADDIVRQYGVDDVGPLPGLHEKYYVVSTERTLKHPGVVALTNEARNRVF